MREPETETFFIERNHRHMDHAGRQKLLGILAFFQILPGSLSLLFGLLMVHGSTTFVNDRIRSLNPSADVTPLFIAIGIILLFEGVFAIASAFYLNQARSSNKYLQSVFYFTLIALIFNFINLFFSSICNIHTGDLVAISGFMFLNAIVLMVLNSVRKQSI